MTKQELIQKRHNIDRLRENNSLSPNHAEQLEESIFSSWQRSSHAKIPKDRLAAPLKDEKAESLRKRILQNMES